MTIEEMLDELSEGWHVSLMAEDGRPRTWTLTITRRGEGYDGRVHTYVGKLDDVVESAYAGE